MARGELSLATSTTWGEPLLQSVASRQFGTARRQARRFDSAWKPIHRPGRIEHWSQGGTPWRIARCLLGSSVARSTAKSAAPRCFASRSCTPHTSRLAPYDTSLVQVLLPPPLQFRVVQRGDGPRRLSRLLPIATSAMTQIFHPSMNPFSKFSIFGAVFILAVAGWMLWVMARSSYTTNVRVVRPQPIQFSHEHHVSGLGIDCRYCHTSVEEHPFAGIPPTETCMQCHSQIWADSPKLELVRSSYLTNRSIPWTRVHNTPDFVHFDHSIHVNKGIGCATCHGPVDEMPLMWRAETLHMQWCLDCHRHPEQYVQPRDTVFQLDWQRPADDPHLGQRLVEEYDIEKLDRCSICHY